MPTSLDADTFAFVCRYVHERSGIVLDAGKHYMVVSRLSALAATLHMASATALVAALREGGGGADLGRRVVETMTVGETRFFRDGHPFRLIGELADAARSTGERLDVWSAACASGQEPYSIAMAAREAGLGGGGPPVRVLATDLSTAAVARTAAGRYDAHEIRRGLPDALRDKYFDASDDEAAFVARPVLRGTVETRPMNLILPWPTLPRFDAIFLRNVLIYFDDATRARVLGRVRRHLRPGGWLVLGCAESPRGYVDGLDRAAGGPAGCFRNSLIAAADRPITNTGAGR